MSSRLLRLAATAFLVISFITAASAARASSSFIGSFSSISTVASAVPANGDINPYGVAVVPRSTGNLIAGNVLVSNFNNKANLQGTGTTIVEIAPNGRVRLFSRIDPTAVGIRCPGGIGLSTALVALRSGWVIVGSLPTTDGTAATAKAGCLLVLNRYGRVVETITGPLINGPWDMTALDGSDSATLFVTNVLNGTVAAGGKTVNKGTVVRLALDLGEEDAPQLRSETVVGKGFPERTDPSSLVIGPTGLALSGETLYVADSLGNRIAAIPDAVERQSAANQGSTVSHGGALNDPLGAALAPNGDILTVNGNDGNLVETTPAGYQFAPKQLDNTGSPPGAGTLFGLAVVPNGQGLYFVDDGTNTLNLLH
jgi:hypothetical protein